MSDPAKSVECGEHGTRQATFVCYHLTSGTSRGFNYASEDSDDPYPDAWCDQCEEALQIEGEWNDRSEAIAKITLVCDRCYETARERNWREDTKAFKSLVTDAVAYLQNVQDTLRERFRIGDYERYEWDQDSGQLILSHGGQAKVLAQIQFVGSVSTRSRTWLWSWANGSIVESARADIRKVRKHGEDCRFLKLASAHWDASEVDGWEMTAVSAYLLRAQGAYRTPDDNGFSFMVLTDVQHAH